MRNLLVLTIVLLAACSTATAEPPVHGATPGRTCRSEDPDRFIGQPGTSETGAEILRATNSAVLRWAPPGTMLTMDFREDRVTIYLGPDYKVTKIACG
jgi:hypothetical protein